ncbi:MAG: P pilus assembly/Cpx signaling pathway, periplasmic inhibitor/zinc-resistance associated protein [Mojavia pulchra JT2-VF2]|jgi:Spy/CpxP family protein refolding chaperone|uniref:P pilus assembly/Cpx signaling pathway, periplasmic inhibitor/zinc-resistance associated protein n=1 Tax=Mojavia pulchra JT2-VF2 TaxID=287848 RepID=A0A951Q5J1_9NOST|nr:P pilus assembly/Cpx signaling pathway, periplasmic inhibitor/zinc-resistance associated protein [Mojavia pulchra JT2-VF2]
MNLKKISLVAGAIALTLSATPFAVKAQTGFSSNRLVAQAQNTQTPNVKAPKKGLWRQLGLTDAQQSQIEAIRRETRTQMEAVLTQEQKNQLQEQLQARQAQRDQRQAGQQPGQRPNGRQAGERPNRGFARLNLTEAQKAQMKQIMESSQQRIQAVLTPEQRTKLQELRENARSRRQQRNSNQGPQS